MLGVMVILLLFMVLVIAFSLLELLFHSIMLFQLGPGCMFLLNVMDMIWFGLLVIVLFGGITFVISGGRFRARFRN